MRVSISWCAWVMAVMACGDSGSRESDTQASSITQSSISNLTNGISSQPASEGGLTGGSEAGSGGTTAGSTGLVGETGVDATSAPKFDVNGGPGSDIPPDMDGPIIPTTCEEAASGKSTVGCKFYAVDMDSHDLAETSQYAVAVANVQLSAMANVTVETKEGGVWTVVGGPTVVGPLQLFVFNLADRHQDDTGLRAGGAYRVTADVPVVAYQFNPVDGSVSYLSDAAMLYPAAALDTINHVTAWRSMVDNTGTTVRSYATVIATADGTTVTVDPSVVTAAGAGVPQGAPGAPYQVAMAEGDVLNIAAQSVPDSMTGTRITSNADHPVAVFAGQECALIPESVCCCDHMEEQLAGVRQWGKSFIAARMPVRNPGAPEQTLWQIYASEDATNVTITADPGVTGIPAPNFVLSKGQMSEFYASGPPGEEGDFAVTADKPIAVYAYMVGSENFGSSIGDPAMVAMAPSEQYLPRYVMLVPATWVNDFALVSRPTGAQILLDGVAISDAMFNPVAASGFEVARVPLADGVHVFDGGDEKFSVIIVGYDEYDSYAYLGGTGTGKINPNPPG